MTALQWILLAHVLGECLDQQAEYQLGTYPWVVFEIPLRQLELALEAAA